MNSKISLVINYAGLQLAVFKNEQGENVTPLKPLSDVFGLLWRDQRKKVTGTASQMRRFGISEGDIPPSGANSEGDIPPSKSAQGMDTHASTANSDRAARGYSPEVFIRLDRVAYYLMSINPEKVRLAGNSDGADYLEKKQDEWADALHDYEELGAAFNMNHAKAVHAMNRQRMQFVQMVGAKNKTADLKDRQAITKLMLQMASQLGIDYQPDLLDGA